MDGSEAGVDLVLIQAFLLYYVNQVILMLTSIFQGQFPQQSKAKARVQSPELSNGLFKARVSLD